MKPGVHSLVVVAAAVVVAAPAAASTSAKRSAWPRCTSSALLQGLRATPVGSGELAAIGRAAQVSIDQAGVTLARAWGDTSAIGGVEIDVSRGPDTVDSVLFFVHQRAQTVTNLRGGVAAVDARVAMHGGSATVHGNLAGLSSPSLVWTLRTLDSSGQPIVARVIDEVVSRVTVGAVAGSSGTTMDSAGAPHAAALARWAIAHLARIVKLGGCTL